MRHLIMCCLISTLISAKYLNQQPYKVPLEKILIAQQRAATCAEEHNVDSGIMAKVLDATIPDDDLSKKFLYCFGRSINVIAEDGHIIVDRIASLLGDHALLEEFKESIRECNKITKENSLDTAMAMNSCVRKNAPIIFVI